MTSAVKIIDSSAVSPVVFDTRIESIERGTSGSLSGPSHFAFIDALRGVAILGVLITHSAVETPGLPSHLAQLLDYAHFGVQLFFVVSAATLFQSLEKRHALDRRPISAFFLRRVARIGPLFWLGGAYYIWRPFAYRIVLAPHGIKPSFVIATAFFLHGFSPSVINTVVPGGWSIADEVMFYVLLPLLFRRVVTLKSALELLAFTTLLIGLFGPEGEKIFRQFSSGVPDACIDSFAYFNFLNQLPVFECGIVLSFLLSSNSTCGNSPNKFVVGPKMLVLIATLFIFQLVPGHIYAAMGFALLSLTLSRFPLRGIVNPIIIYLGKISFSVYIWHFATLDFISPWVRSHLQFHSMPHYLNAIFGFLITLIAVIVLTIPIAALSFAIIEQTGIRAGRFAIRRLGWGG